jgi:hypothetical protein
MRSVISLIGVVHYYNTTLVSMHLTKPFFVLAVRFLATAPGDLCGDLQAPGEARGRSDRALERTAGLTV